LSAFVVTVGLSHPNYEIVKRREFLHIDLVTGPRACRYGTRKRLLSPDSGDQPVS